MSLDCLKQIINKLRDRHIRGPGGIAQLLPIAFPIIVSHASDMAMMFVDRLYLARLSELHMASAMTGGLAVFSSLTFFVGIAGYTNAMVAHHLGANRKQQCPVALVQTAVLIALSIPVIAALSHFGPALFRLFGHTAEQLHLEQSYYAILMAGGTFVLGRIAFVGFFAGLGRTRVVMIEGGVCMVVNIVLNYILIFGKLGFPALGIVGAAWGTVLARLAALTVLMTVYFSRYYRQNYGTHRARRFSKPMFAKLIRFGLPAGIELFLNVTAFNLVVQMLHSYGRAAASAVTITFNWDMVAFIPMVGFNIATMSLVGRYVGANDARHAARSACSGLKMAYAYASVMVILFVTVPGLLAAPFTPDQTEWVRQEVLPLAHNMIRLAAIYTLADATYLVFGGALRGAGDTKWIMRTSALLHWLMVVAVFIAVKVVAVPPIYAWGIFVFFVVMFGTAALSRFLSGKWKDIRIVER